MSTSGFNIDLVNIAPSPVFTGLDRLNQGMTSGTKMLGRVMPRRRVATSDVTTRETEPEMQPSTAGLETFLTSAGLRLDIFHLIEMGTFIHKDL